MTISPKILKAAARGDRRAQKKLYELSFDMLMGICMRYKTNQEDGVAILNDAYLKILNNLENLNPKIPYEAWAKRITINCCINDYRKQKHSPEYIYMEKEAMLDHFVRVEDDDWEESQLVSVEKLKELLNELPDSSQEVFQLYVLEGYNHREIAEILGISEGTSKWHLNNARKILRRLLKDNLNINRRVAL
ncbi:RNA polymerase sigma factor [bacterium SCSIO 12741]|nr:RNA polymerase sigma factor [bacterium SCSIO 12741]